MEIIKTEKINRMNEDIEELKNEIRERMGDPDFDNEALEELFLDYGLELDDIFQILSELY